MLLLKYFKHLNEKQLGSNCEIGVLEEFKFLGKLSLSILFHSYAYVLLEKTIKQ